MNDSVTHRYRWRIIQSPLTRGHKRTKYITIPSNHFKITKVPSPIVPQLMSNTGCDAVALWLDKQAWNFSDSLQSKATYAWCKNVVAQVETK